MGKIKIPFVFFKDETEAKISDNELYVNGAESAIVTIEGEGEVEIQGLADLNSTEWHSLALIDKSDFAVYSSLDKSGIFSCSIDGYWKIRAEIKSVSGNLSVYANIL